MTRHFDYKPAPLAKERRLVLEERSARIETKDGIVEQEVRFDDVDTMRFVERTAREFRMSRLDLIHGPETFRFACNGMRLDVPSEPPRSTFYVACTALLERLAQVKPQLEVTIDESKKIRRFWFALGLFALLLGIGLPTAAFLTGARSYKIVQGLVPSALLVLFGLGVTVSNRPWRPSPRVPPASLVETLRQIAAATGDDGRAPR